MLAVLTWLTPWQQLFNLFGSPGNYKLHNKIQFPYNKFVVPSININFLLLLPLVPLLPLYLFLSILSPHAVRFMTYGNNTCIYRSASEMSTGTVQ
jgi:hypothetical protein